MPLASSERKRAPQPRGVPACRPVPRRAALAWVASWRCRPPRQKSRASAAGVQHERAQLPCLCPCLIDACARTPTTSSCNAARVQRLPCYFRPRPRPRPRGVMLDTRPKASSAAVVRLAATSSAVRGPPRPPLAGLPGASDGVPMDSTGDIMGLPASTLKSLPLAPARMRSSAALVTAAWRSRLVTRSCWQGKVCVWVGGGGTGVEGEGMVLQSSRGVVMRETPAPRPPPPPEHTAGECGILGAESLAPRSARSSLGVLPWTADEGTVVGPNTGRRACGAAITHAAHTQQTQATNAAHSDKYIAQTAPAAPKPVVAGQITSQRRPALRQHTHPNPKTGPAPRGLQCSGQRP